MKGDGYVRSAEAAVSVPGWEVTCTLGAVATVMDGQGRIDMHDFPADSGSAHGHALSSIDLAGNCQVSLDGRFHRGRRDESVVLNVLRQWLDMEQLDWCFDPGAQDAEGEDAVIQFGDGSRLTVQIVSVPTDQGFNHELALGSVERIVGAPQAAGWLQEAIAHKTKKINPQQRERTMLVLDIRHAGILADERIRKELAGLCPDLAATGFAQIRAVGPVIGRCWRLL